LDDPRTDAAALSVRRWPIHVRRARSADRGQVVEFASRTWDGWDYVPHAFDHWLTARDGVLLVATVGRPADGRPPLDAAGELLEIGQVVAVARVALLSPTEAWLEGIRVDSRVRGMSVATDLQAAELHWAAAQASALVRYATGERNEGSHRLGARHGFARVAAFQTWRTAPTDEDEREPSGYEPAIRAAATARRQAALARLAEAGLVAAAHRSAELWPKLSEDPVFAAAARLYELRSWAFQALDEHGFASHLAAGEVLTDSADDDGWALAILPAVALPAEDSSLHLALLAGDSGAVARLAGRIGRLAEMIRFRLPLGEGGGEIASGAEAALREAGFEPRPFTLHILARPLAGTRLPALDPATTVLEEEPTAALRPPLSRAVR
jgi:hypothetical protein